MKILILSGYEFDAYVQAAMRVPVDGYLTKDATQEELVRGLREIVKGGAVLAPLVASRVIRTHSSRLLERGGGDRIGLTARELAVLELMSQGYRNAPIADRLGISTRTVEAHVSSIIMKLQAEDRKDVLKIAAEKGIFT